MTAVQLVNVRVYLMRQTASVIQSVGSMEIVATTLIRYAQVRCSYRYNVYSLLTILLFFRRNIAKVTFNTIEHVMYSVAPLIRTPNH